MKEGESENKNQNFPERNFELKDDSFFNLENKHKNRAEEGDLKQEKPKKSFENNNSLSPDIKYQNEDAEDEVTRPAVRTYRDFAVKALKKKPTSLAKMIIREKKREEVNYKYSPKNKRNILMIILSATLVLLGVFAVGAVLVFTIYKKEDVAIKDKPIAPKSIIYFDYKSEHELDDVERSDILKLIKDIVENTTIPIGSNKIFYFVKRKDDGHKRLATAREFFEILDTRASGGFIRSLEDEFTTGVISTIEKISPFMIIKVSDFDTAYTAILSWEKTMLIDLGDIFNVNKKYFVQKFSDLSLYNKDTRVILDEEGKVVFGYVFLDLKTLVFFTDNDAFRKIVALLETQKEKF